MPLTIVGAAVAAGTSVTLPAHQSGDKILILAFSTSSSAAPSLASGFSSSGLTVANSGDNRFRFAERTAASNSETSGTWTGASAVGVWVFRGWDVADFIGGYASPGLGTSSTVNYSGLTMERTDNTSFRVAAVMVASAGTVGSPPSGWTRGALVDDGTFKYLVDHTTTGTSSGAAVIPAYSFGSSVQRISWNYEIKAEPDPVGGAVRPLVNGFAPILINGGLIR